MRIRFIAAVVAVCALVLGTAWYLRPSQSAVTHQPHPRTPVQDRPKIEQHEIAHIASVEPAEPLVPAVTALTVEEGTNAPTSGLISVSFEVVVTE